MSLLSPRIPGAGVAARSLGAATLLSVRIPCVESQRVLWALGSLDCVSLYEPQTQGAMTRLVFLS